MPKYLVLPKIGMNMEEALIGEWLVKPGDKVEKDQMVVRAETDKAIQDIFATEAGVVYKLLAEPGDIVSCQERIAILLDEGEEYKEEDEGQEVPGNTEQENLVEDMEKTDFRISPLAKKTAKELGISEETLNPAEKGKRIVKADVLRCAEEQKAFQTQSEEDIFVPFSRKRQVIARRMTESSNQKPRVTMVTTVECERLMAFREHLKTKARIGYNEILAKACSAVLRKNPEWNCIRKEEGVLQKSEVNIGIAVDTKEGLLVPVLKNVDKKGV